MAPLRSGTAWAPTTGADFPSSPLPTSVCDRAEVRLRCAWAHTHMSPPLSLVLPSDPASLRTARRAVTDYSRQNGFEQELIERARLAVTEACTNVVLHAYDGDGSGTNYELDARVEDRALVVRIRDSGVGMPAEGATRPRPNFGFGFPVMRETASSVDVVARAGGGTEIVLRFVAL